MKDGEVGLYAVDDDMEVLKEIRGPEQGYSGKYKDAISGQALRDKLVVEARAKELQYFLDKGVWQKRPRQEAFAKLVTLP